MSIDDAIEMAEDVELDLVLCLFLAIAASLFKYFFYLLATMTSFGVD